MAEAEEIQITNDLEEFFIEENQLFEWVHFAADDFAYEGIVPASFTHTF